MKHFTPYTTTDLLFSEKRFIQSEMCFFGMVFADSIFFGSKSAEENNRHMMILNKILC